MTISTCKCQFGIGICKNCLSIVTASLFKSIALEKVRQSPRFWGSLRSPLHWHR